jgi:hypothetical protein
MVIMLKCLTILGWLATLVFACISSEAYSNCLTHYKASLSLHLGFCPVPNSIQWCVLVLMERGNHLLLGKTISTLVISPSNF